MRVGASNVSFSLGAGGTPIVSLTNGAGNLLLLTRRPRGRLHRHRRGQPAGRLARRDAAPADQHDVGRDRPEVRGRRRRDAARAAARPVPPLRGDRRDAERPRPDAERRRDVREVAAPTSRSRSRTPSSRSAAASSPSPARARRSRSTAPASPGTSTAHVSSRGSGRSVLRQPHGRRRHAHGDRTCASTGTQVDLTIAGPDADGQLLARAGPERGRRAGREDRRSTTSSLSLGDVRERRRRLGTDPRLDRTASRAASPSTVTLTLPGVTSSGGTFKIEINTTPTDVTEAFTVGGTTTTLTLPAGPVRRGAGARRLAHDRQRQLASTATSRSTSKDGVTRVAATELDITIGGRSVLVGGEGAFVVTTRPGVAGYFSGKATVGPRVRATCSSGVNKTGRRGRRDDPGRRRARSTSGSAPTRARRLRDSRVTDLTLNIGDFVTIEGDVAFSGRHVRRRRPVDLPRQGPRAARERRPQPARDGRAALERPHRARADGRRLRARRRGRREPRRDQRRHDLRPRVGAREHDRAGRSRGRSRSRAARRIPIERELHERRRRQELRRHRRADRACSARRLSGNLSFESTAGGDVAVAASNVTLALTGVSLTNGSGALLLTPAGARGQAQRHARRDDPGHQLLRLVRRRPSTRRPLPVSRDVRRRRRRGRAQRPGRARTSASRAAP